MIIFIKKLKTKEGINSFDSEKIKKGIPAGYKASAAEPIITLTANHVLIAYKCEQIVKSNAKPELKTKEKEKKIAAPATKKAPAAKK